MKRKIIIIGGGIAGLTAGIYAQQSGYDSLILEKNPNVGGLCTGWKRKGRYIDGCVHWLTGTKEGTTLHKIWTNIGAFSNQDDLIYLPTWGSFNYQGTEVTFYKDLDLAEKSWLEISPQDKRAIHLFFKTIRKMIKVELPLNAPAPLLPFKDKMKLVGSLIKTYPYYTRGMHKTCASFANKFKHPALRWAINQVQPGEGNLYSMMFSYATIADNNGGIPKGGSYLMSERIKERYFSLGGELRLNSEVTSLDKKGNKITSITLQNGEKVTGDYYVTCCDTNYVLINLLKNKYVFSKIAERYNNPRVHPAPSCVLINYEVPTIKDINIPYCFKVDPFKLGNKTIDGLNVRSFQYDPSFVSEGKTILQVLVDQDSNDYDYWYDLYKNQDEYMKTKKDFGLFVQNIIVKFIPELQDNIRLLDVATPVTIARYVNASRGSYMSFLFNHKKGVISSKGKLFGIKNLYLSGQYVQTPGGLPLAAASGKFSIDWINHDFKKR